MDDLDLPKKSDSPLDRVCREDLSDLSVHELEERITRLKMEIERAQAAADAKQGSKAEADKLFKF